MNGSHAKMIDDCRLELVSIEKWISNNRLNSNVKYLVSYAVIKASGTTERIYKNIVYDYLNTGVNSETSNYLTSTILESSSNPSFSKISELLNQMNRDWNKEFKKRCEANCKTDLDSLVKLRNSFSHGGSITVSIENIIEYFESAAGILIILDEVINRE